MRYPIPVFLLALIAFTAYLAVRRKKQSDRQQEVNEAFLDRERAANATRKKDISNLDYLPFSSDRLPLGKDPDKELASYESLLKDLSEKKILNLSSHSNTDLKLMYGPANLNSLMEYDDNYHTLSITLFAYARRKAALGQEDDAIACLEYAMELKIDTSQIYLLLAELYQKRHEPEKIQTIETALSSMDESFAALVRSKLAAFRAG